MRAARLVLLTLALAGGLSLPWAVSHADVESASARPPDFCVRHPTNPNCLTTSTTTSSSTTVPTTTAPTTTSTPPLGEWSSSTLGISTGYITDANTDQQTDGLRDVGADAWRTDCPWYTAESSPGVFNWSVIDSAVARANARGLRFMCAVWQTPGWANGNQGTRVPPTDPESYGRFVEALVRHLSPQGVKVYEVWNEPNISAFWTSPNVAKYTALLKSAYVHAKLADPSVIVLGGAMSPHGGYADVNCDGAADSGSDGTGISAPRFLEGIYANGGGGSFDALSHHPYDRGGFAFHVCSAWSQLQETTPSLRSIMEANGDAAKKIWGTEWGFSTATAWGYTEAQQAASLTQGVNLWRSYAWAGPLMWFNYHDNGEMFGLTRVDWTHRLAWDAFRSVAG